MGAKMNIPIENYKRLMCASNDFLNIVRCKKEYGSTYLVFDSKGMAMTYEAAFYQAKCELIQALTASGGDVHLPIELNNIRKHPYEMTEHAN